MSTITMKNRYESYKKIQENPYTLYAKVLAILSDNKELSAREIAKAIGLSSRQDIQPRLNELRDKYGLIEEVGETRDKETWRTVTTYKLAEITELEKERLKE